MDWLNRRPLLTSSLVGVLVGVLVAAAWTVARPEPGSPVSSTTTTWSSPHERPPTQAELDAAVDELLAFVADERGLEARQEVDVELQSEEEFLEGLLDQLETAGEELAGLDATLQALKLVEEGFDLEKELEESAAGAVIGYYDPELDTLFVRGKRLSPFVRVTLVHELVHALQDQHFGLDAIEDIEDDEASAGARALVEGDAAYITEQYLSTLSSEDQGRLVGEAAGVLGPAVFEGLGEEEVLGVLDAVLRFPYVEGPAFIAELLEKGEGFERVDEAFEELPVSTEQILHPAKFLAGEEPIDVELPEAGGEILDDGRLGEFLLGYLLDPTLIDEEAREAAEGWGGDAYVTWRSGGRLHITVRVVMDSEKDRDEMVEALRAWAREHGSARVREDGRDLFVEASALDASVSSGSTPRGSAATWRGGRRGG